MDAARLDEINNTGLDRFGQKRRHILKRAYAFIQRGNYE